MRSRVPRDLRQMFPRAGGLGVQPEGTGATQLEAQQGASIYKCQTFCSSREEPGTGTRFRALSGHVSLVTSGPSSVGSASLTAGFVRAQRWARRIRFSDTQVCPRARHRQSSPWKPGPRLLFGVPSANSRGPDGAISQDTGFPLGVRLVSR